MLEGTGTKEATYKIPYKTMKERVRLVDEENNIWKLSKEQAEKIRKKHKEYQQQKEKETEGIPFSEIQDDLEFREIVEIINEDTPNRLEKKKAELAKKGIKTQPEPKYINILKKVISVEWMLEWFEPQKNGGEKNGRS